MKCFIAFACAAMLLAGPAAARADDWCLDGDGLRVEIDGATVTVCHDAARYNCCPDPFQYAVSWDFDTLVVTETEVLTNPCYCLCCYDLSTTIEDVPPGQFTLRLRWFDYETLDWAQLEAPFGVDDVGQSGTHVLGASQSSGCLAASGNTARSWSRVKTLYR
ncbi:hypothetical protein KKG45_03910 [bacterium]|nr:hypothetical protein [bacterium]MBU1072373.1 hypothetical protein [bacterium]MBU1676892.1 hypothetical protein [bacterium]